MVKIILAFAITCALIICSIQLISAFKCKDVLFSIVVIKGIKAGRVQTIIVPANFNALMLK